MTIFLSSLVVALALAAIGIMTYAQLRVFNRPYFGRDHSAQPAQRTQRKPAYIFVRHLESRHWWEYWIGSWIVRRFCKESPELRERKSYAHLHLPENVTTPLPLVVYTHGNGAIIEEVTFWLEHLIDAGFALLVTEYRGFGEAGGHPLRPLINEDLCFFYDEAIKTGHIDTQDITFYGRSLGGGITCDLARERKAHRLILESTYFTLREISGADFLPDYVFIGKDFECASLVQSFPGDILICHGHADTVSPIAQAHKLQAIRPDLQLEVFDAKHADIYQKPEYMARVRSFLKQKPSR